MSRNESTTKELVPSVRKLQLPLPGVVATLVGGKPAYQVLTVPRGVAVIGRGGTSDIVLDDEHASRQHVELKRDEDRWRVRDLGSRNGTFVDGKRLEPHQEGFATKEIRFAQTVLLLEDLRRFGQPHDIFHATYPKGPSLLAALDMISLAAREGQNVLVTGETGVGKEGAARHFHSALAQALEARDAPYVAMNAAAIPENLVESELFGHVRGAFSGATVDRVGALEAANGGALFLDEVGDMPIAMQAKLLRALQEGEIRRVGETRVRHVRVRVVAATNHDLAQRVEDGQFRADLLYRLAQCSVRLPPLRERREEIVYLAVLALRSVEGAPTIGVGFLEECVLRPWPGNVRELLDACKHAAIHARHAGRPQLSASDLPSFGGPTSEDVPAASSAPMRPLGAAERDDAVRAAFRKFPDDPVEIGRKLGMSTSTVYRYLKKLGLETKRR